MDWKQRVFDKAVLGIRKQGKPAAAKDGAGHLRCLYRTKDGCCCNVGILLPPDLEISDRANQRVVGDLLYNYPNVEGQLRKDLEIPASLSLDDLIAFLRQWQKVHDVGAGQNDFMEEYLRQAAGFAELHELDKSALTAELAA